MITFLWWSRVVKAVMYLLGVRGVCLFVCLWGHHLDLVISHPSKQRKQDVYRHSTVFSRFAESCNLVFERHPSMVGGRRSNTAFSYWIHLHARLLVFIIRLYELLYTAIWTRSIECERNDTRFAYTI